ncbi:hypothetical protein LWM68_43905 [Niabella sp. W65]|nr:hypothetical protein [Niabella sp. W65]MCH7369068.1 hypothetical protein [Niabella sp. W65]ULT44633.1 hypothetical protein KRR40_15640 [Niabella sp. I65]
MGWFDDPNINDVWNTNTNSWDYYYNYNLEEILMRKQSPKEISTFR